MLATPGGGLTDLGVLGGVVRYPAASGINAIAYGINAAGQIVGTSTYNGAPFYYAQHAFLTTASGPMVDLGTLGGNFSNAFGINASGQIVGSASTSGDAAGHGFLYAGGVMNDLNTMIGSASGWQITNASSINDSGQIVGQGNLSDGSAHAVRMDPADLAVGILTNLLADPSLGLAGGQVSSLTDKLNNALASIQGGLNKQAVNQLNALISAVQTQVKVGKMSVGTGNTLVAAASAIIESLT
jgi:probable HAF family extracellular repeat protein